MSEKTLKQIDQEAQEHREESTSHYNNAHSHRRAADFLAGSAMVNSLYLRQDSVESGGVTTHRNNASAEELRSRADEQTKSAGERLVKAAFEQHLGEGADKRAEKHYHQNEATYYENAIIDAHREGVVINVEQPIEIGQKIEVHTSNHQ